MATSFSGGAQALARIFPVAETLKSERPDSEVFDSGTLFTPGVWYVDNRIPLNTFLQFGQIPLMPTVGVVQELCIQLHAIHVTRAV
ncbi:MAG: hypothetical protein ABGX16_23245 [Pirellulales bacterium]